jgi:hypothetical protein
MTNPAIGTNEHAALISHSRHPGVQTAMAWLTFSHLPPALATLSEPAYLAAMELLERIPTDSAELTTALNKLVEAKDWFVRAGIRNDCGRPGPVCRPATVVDPPARPMSTADLPPFGSAARKIVDRPPFPTNPLTERPQA